MAVRWDCDDVSEDAVNYDGLGDTFIFVRKIRNKFWVCNGRYHDFPPASRIAGPFPTLDAAKLAAELMFE